MLVSILQSLKPHPSKLNLKHFFFCSDNFIVAWKRGIAILSAGTVKVTPDPRVNLLVQNGEFSLQIENAGPQDAGDYICQIATLEPLEITHTVEILGKSLMRKVSLVTSSINLFCHH